MARQSADEEQTTTVTVYQLYRGNHREDPHAMAAVDVRMNAGREIDDVAPREFDRLWSEVGQDEIAEEEPEAVLGAVWTRWNRGSGRESREFYDAETRSLEVGDVVEIDGTYWLCAAIGWEEIESLPGDE